jgi:hypothetical protein
MLGRLYVPVVIATGCLSLTIPVHAFATQLYDVDFSSPTHTVGATPAVGFGPFPRDTPTEVVSGDPIVVSSFGALEDQPLHFDDGNVGNEQIAFALSNGEPRYLTEFDLLIKPVPFDTATFSVFLDAPFINRITFEGDGTISLIQFGGVGPNGAIGSYLFDELMHVAIDVDLPSLTWSIEIEDQLIHHGPFSSTEGDVTNLRFSAFFGNYSTPMGTAAIDNVTISSLPPIPEPASFSLVVLGLAAFSLKARREGRRLTRRSS